MSRQADGRSASPSLDRLAFLATVHCLTGCSIGEIAGMVIGTAVGLSNASTIVLSVVLAFVFGYILTMIPLLRARVPFARALTLALASDTVSIAVMEAVDNALMLVIPGAMDAGLTDALFWSSLAISLLTGGFAAFPVVRWLIGRGRGHAVVHQYSVHEHASAPHASHSYAPHHDGSHSHAPHDAHRHDGRAKSTGDR